ncbi:MAG: MraY family glycosyltransferase, partial [Traorella sp.]
MEWSKYLILPFVITLVLTPFVMWIAKYIDAYAKINARTIHTKTNIARIGGVAIYVAFMISMTCFMKSDVQIRALILGSSIMFFGGLIDDLVDLSSKQKLLFQIFASLVIIFYGKTMLGKIFLPFGIVIDMGFISYIVTFFWLIGITNAVNLIDGLDGLAAGISLIILVVIASLSVIDNRPDITQVSLMLVGSIAAFLIFNFNPAKIFLGDCGALFLGFMIASISLMGFKSGTFITLGLPILMCGVPIVDTLSAIIRRKLSGKRFDEADKNHLHHVLMRKFGHKNTVLILYAVTLCSGLVAYIYIINDK